MDIRELSLNQVIRDMTKWMASFFHFIFWSDFIDCFCNFSNDDAKEKEKDKSLA
jgi:hypothetical protein